MQGMSGKRIHCFLGEPTRRHPILSCRAPPRRPAVRRPTQIRPWYVRVSNSTGQQDNGRSFFRTAGQWNDTFLFSFFAHARHV